MTPNIDIKDQFGDTLFGRLGGRRAYIGIVPNHSNNLCDHDEVELTKDEIKQLRDWCNELLEFGMLE